QKADVLAHVDRRSAASVLAAASPKARRLAAERGVDLRELRGSGPGGAVLVTDLPSPSAGGGGGGGGEDDSGVPNVWRIMAERMTASWTTAPHFYLFREVNVSRLVSWRGAVSKHASGRITYTDLLVKLVAVTLSRHPRVNASWRDGRIARNADIN